MRWRNLYSLRVRRAGTRMLVIFDLPPTADEISWLIDHIPAALDHADKQTGTYPETSEVIYTHKAEYLRLGGKL